jgi:hypothetical protein
MIWHYLGLIGTFVLGYFVHYLKGLRSRKFTYEEVLSAYDEGREDERRGFRVVGE